VLLILGGTLLLTLLYATGAATKDRVSRRGPSKPEAPSVEERFKNRSRLAGDGALMVDNMPDDDVLEPIDDADASDADDDDDVADGSTDAEVEDESHDDDATESMDGDGDVPDEPSAPDETDASETEPSEPESDGGQEGPDSGEPPSDFRKGSSPMKR